MAFGLLGGAIGILLLLVGVFLVFWFPTTTAHQSEHFGKVGIVLGIVFLIIGGILLFT